MEIFRDFCSSEFDAAVKRGEVALRNWGGTYETPAGLDITRFAGGVLMVECDFGELNPDDGQRVLKIDWTTTPPEVTEVTHTEDAQWSNTIRVSEHDNVAGELAKYVTLLVE